LSARLNNALYRVTVNGEPAGERIVVDAPTDVVFEFQDAEGLLARERFRFEPDGYVLSYSAAIADQGRSLNPVLQWGPGLGDTIHIAGQQSSFGIYVQRPQGILFRDGSVERLDASTIRQTPTYAGRSRSPGLTTTTSSRRWCSPGSWRSPTNRRRPRCRARTCSAR
jgi:hypothetical protein